VSEHFLNGTSAQLGYIVPFTSVYTRKYVTEDKNRYYKDRLISSLTYIRHWNVASVAPALL